MSLDATTPRARRRSRAAHRAPAFRAVPRLASPRLAPHRAGNFLEYKDQKLVYKRYASLFFVMGIGKEDNELM